MTSGRRKERSVGFIGGGQWWWCWSVVLVLVSSDDVDVDDFDVGRGEFGWFYMVLVLKTSIVECNQVFDERCWRR